MCSSPRRTSECQPRGTRAARPVGTVPRPAAGTGRDRRSVPPGTGLVAERSGDGRTGDAVGLRHERELEQVGDEHAFGSVRLWLVSDRDGDAARRAASGRPRGRRGTAPSGRASGWPAIGDRLDAEPVGDATACTARSAAMSPTIAARVAASSASPPYRARAQRTRSLDVVAIEPAAAGGGHDRGERRDLGAVGQVDRPAASGRVPTKR